MLGKREREGERDGEQSEKCHSNDCNHMRQLSLLLCCERTGKKNVGHGRIFIQHDLIGLQNGARSECNLTYEKQYPLLKEEFSSG